MPRRGPIHRALETRGSEDREPRGPNTLTSPHSASQVRRGGARGGAA